MPRRLTRSEISTRITVKVLLEARPGMTRQQLVAFFHVSTRTVTDAARHSLAYWANILVAAPEPAKPARTRYSPARGATKTRAKRPASRAWATLVTPEATVEYQEQVDFDVPEPVIDDDAVNRAAYDADDALDRKLRGAKDGKK